MAQTIAVDALLALAAAVIVSSAVALWLVRSAYDRVHVIAPAAMLGVPLLATALLVNQGVSPLSVKGLLVTALFWLSAPTLSHATLRAARFRAPRRHQSVDR
jgi:multisubunit Na+/H+ antiporter MnhG subunit